jgi:hypothetical protein
VDILRLRDVWEHMRATFEEHRGTKARKGGWVRVQKTT